MPCLSAFGVSAGSRRSTLMDLGPEEVSSTCPENFAELDPDCLSRLLSAGKSFKGGAEACRLSLTWPRRLLGEGGIIINNNNIKEKPLPW